MRGHHKVLPERGACDTRPRRALPAVAPHLEPVLRGYTDSTIWVSLLVASVTACGVHGSDLRSPRPLPSRACLVVGLLGGLDAWDDESKGIRRLALETRRRPGVFAETFENRRAGLARAFILDALDANGDGGISRAENDRVRLVVYGQSLGGGAAVALARVLVIDGVEIELLLLLDSVGRHDDVAPPSVRHAVLLYQDEGWFVRGEPSVRARDPTRTRALAAREFDYDRPPGSTISLEDLAWHEIAFRAAHARMDRDPRVWALADSLVRAACAGTLAAAP